MKTLIKLTVAALIVHAAWQAGNVYWRYHMFKDGVQSTAQFSGAGPIDDLQDRVMEIAAQYRIPLESDQVTVRREMNHTLIDAVYSDRIEILPSYFYPWEFRVNVDAFTIAPQPE
jgi:hypothetical protein